MGTEYLPREAADNLHRRIREPRHLRSDPLLTSSLPPFFALAAPHRLAVLKALWPSITGEALANHSDVVGIQGEVMRVRADSGPWLQTLRDLKDTLVVGLQKAAGPLAPRALAFVEGPLPPRPSRPRLRALKPPIPLEDLPEAITGAASRIPSAEGRAAFLRAAAAFRGRFAEN